MIPHTPEEHAFAEGAVTVSGECLRLTIDGVYRSADGDRQMPLEIRFGGVLKRQRRSGLLLSGVVWVTSPCDRLIAKAASHVRPILRILTQRSTSSLLHLESAPSEPRKYVGQKPSSRSQQVIPGKAGPIASRSHWNLALRGQGPEDLRRGPEYRCWDVPERERGLLLTETRI